MVGERRTEDQRGLKERKGYKRGEEQGVGLAQVLYKVCAMPLTNDVLNHPETSCNADAASARHVTDGTLGAYGGAACFASVWVLMWRRGTRKTFLSRVPGRPTCPIACYGISVGQVEKVRLCLFWWLAEECSPCILHRSYQVVLYESRVKFLTLSGVWSLHEPCNMTTNAIYHSACVQSWVQQHQLIPIGRSHSWCIRMLPVLICRMYHYRYSVPKLKCRLCISIESKGPLYFETELVPGIPLAAIKNRDEARSKGVIWAHGTYIQYLSLPLIRRPTVGSGQKGGSGVPKPKREQGANAKWCVRACV